MAATVTVRRRNGASLGDIASIASQKSLVRRLNRPHSFMFRVASRLAGDIQSDGYPLITPGHRQISVTLDGFPGTAFHGIVWTVQDDGDEDMSYSSVVCWDPMIVWRSRPARDNVDSYSGEAGNLSDPSFINRNKFGGLMMQEILTASENPALIPSEAEGPLFLDLAASSFTTGGADLTGAPTNWPMTIAEIATLLTNTGELDLVLTPIVHTPGGTTLANMATLQTYTGNYGTDRTSSVQFDYATGDYNVRLFRRLEDMETVNNKIFYYLGPRLDQQHWRANVTGDHPELEYPPGGSTTVATYNPLGQAIVASRAQIGVFMQNAIYDNFGLEFAAYPLFLRQWQVEGILRVWPRNLVHITPTRDDPNGYGVGDFDIGDLVTVSSGPRSRRTQTGASRIYGFTVDIDDDAVEALGELVTSPDQDAI